MQYERRLMCGTLFTPRPTQPDLTWLEVSAKITPERLMSSANTNTQRITFLSTLEENIYKMSRTFDVLSRTWKDITYYQTRHQVSKILNTSGKRQADDLVMVIKFERFFY